jgi:signal transduction histidine kinase
MTPARSPRRPPTASTRPGRFVFAALLLTLLLAALLGANALLTARYHRSVAEGVLHDYAGFAAGELEARVQGGLAQRLFPLLSVLEARGAATPDVPLLSPSELGASVDSAVWRQLRDSVTVFRLAPDGSLEIRGRELDRPARTRLTDSLPGHARAVLSPTVYFGVLWLGGAGGEKVAVFNAGSAAGESSETVYGLVLPVAALGSLLDPALHRAPLLPPSLTGGTRLDSAVAYRIVAPSGAPLAESAAAPRSYFVAGRTLPPMWGGLRVEVALRPSLAPRLVIGGLPRSRLPVVGALLAVTTVLVLTAAVQLRRERELAQLREEFVAGASHELRTPLAQIRLFTETLRLGRVRTEAERDRSLEIIDQETRRLSHLVENLLYVSRAGRGMLAVSPRAQDVAGSLRDAVEAFGPIAAARRNQVAVDAPERLEGRVDADAFRQIVLNLVDNAIKYGPEGQTVTVRLARHDGLIRLTVDDQGPGVPPAERLRIFERFVRLERDRDANTTGTGLGLALVLELADLHGGRAWAEDAPGGGARMAVEWPQSREA